ncbi:MAG: M3 family oligoendopeptidase [Chitinophagales bacterium]
MKVTTNKIIERPARHFVAEELMINDWSDLEQYYSNLNNRVINSTDDLMQFLKDRSELDKIVEEDYRWRYVRQTCDTENQAYKKEYNDFINNILAHLMEQTNLLNQKIVNSTFFNDLDDDRFFTYKRNLKNDIALYREENIKLNQEEQIKAQQYGDIIASLNITHDGKEYTLQQAAKFLQSSDRDLRKTIYDKVNEQRLKVANQLDELYSELIQIRHQMALNAGFENYRDYKLQALGRFDYGVAESEQFHDAIQQEIMPLVNKIFEKRKSDLSLDALKPYDLDVETSNLPALQPYETTDEFIEKSIACLNDVDSFFADCISIMHNMQYLDLDSRKGKAPGGYNMGMPEINVPFVFMNGSGMQRDVETMVHEAGHAVHSFLMGDLAYNFDQEITSECAELASMSMEFFTHKGLSEFYSEADKKRAIKNHIEGIISILPWIALIDKFQHWVYTHPTHTIAERHQTWNEMFSSFSSSVTNWSNYENIKNIVWQKQLHLFEVPFYYIEYGIAQLGAIGMFKNFKANETATIANYKKALALGSIATLPVMYQTAGVPFDFSQARVNELVSFLQTELAD